MDLKAAVDMRLTEKEILGGSASKGRQHGGRMSRTGDNIMAGQVLVRRKQLHGNASKLVKCDILSSADGKLRCKCEDRNAPEEVEASAVIPATQVMGTSGRPIQKSYPVPVHSLGNRLNK